MKRQLDQILNKYVSRKLRVFAVASLALFTQTLTSGDWVIIAGVYIGTQGAIDAIAKLKQQQ